MVIDDAAKDSAKKMLDNIVEAYDFFVFDSIEYIAKILRVLSEVIAAIKNDFCKQLQL